jgi:hypothetical protein
MIRYRGIFLFLAVTCLSLQYACHAQEVKPGSGFCFDVNAFQGKVYKHTAKFRLPVPERSTGIDLNFQWKTYGRREWHQRTNYPVIGIAVAYTNYGIDSVYGRCFSIYPNIEIPIINTRRFQWTVRLGNGAGYVTRRYARFPYFDTINNAISSNLNDYASLMTDLRWRINEHWDFQVGGNFSHISNAAYKQPNLGINLYGAHVGVKYFPVTSSPKRLVRTLKPLSNRWLMQFRLGMAYTGSNAPRGPNYPVYLATAYASRRWAGRYKYFAGLDYSYHEQINAYVRNNGWVAPGTEAAQSYKIAALAGHEFLLGRLGVILQAGYYLKQAFQVQGKIYQKIGGHYYLVQKEKGPVKEVYLSAFLKTHTANAELAEFGFGMSF